jgi:hypothetical protein
VTRRDNTRPQFGSALCAPWPRSAAEVDDELRHLPRMMARR